MGLLGRLFGIKQVDFKQLVQDGAVIVDVRTVGEYKTGHIKNSVNIPLSDIQRSLNKIPKNKTIITCCASGMRSGSAKQILISNGYTVHNGGGWSSLSGKI
jgi:rhodanese-related sulfurtransferase